MSDPSSVNTSAAAQTTDPLKALSGASARGNLADVLSLDDFVPLAKSRLPRPIFGYVAGAVETNASLSGNRGAFRQWSFVPRVLRDRSQEVELFGTRYRPPFGIAPTGLAALTACDGDWVLARAAAKADVGRPFLGIERISEVDPRILEHAAAASVVQARSRGVHARLSADGV